MTHKGNKSDKTIMLEKLFIAIMRANNMQVFYEYACGTGVIDFVVGLPGEKPDRMKWSGMTGVELKSSMADFRTGNGLNIYAYPYTYILVPEDIAYSAIKHMQQDTKFDHVGVLVLKDDYTLEIHKHAKFKEDLWFYSEMDKRLKKYPETCYMDSVELGLAEDDSIITCHNYETNETWQVKSFFETKVERVS